MSDNIFLEDAEIVASCGLQPVRARRVRPRPGATRRYHFAEDGHAARILPRGAGALPVPARDAPVPALQDDRPSAAESDLRTILTEPILISAIASPVQRAGAIAMAGVMTIALPPVGAGMVVLNCVREADVRLSAHVCALGGLGIALRMLAAPYV